MNSKGELIKHFHPVPAVWEVDLNTGANPGDYISMKGYNRAGALISLGTAGGTCVVTAFQASAVAGTGEKALAFTRAWRTGGRINIKSATGIFTAGETVTGGSSGGTAVQATYDPSNWNLFNYTTKNATAFTDGETLTGGTSGYTAVADGTSYDEDVMFKFTVAANTFTIPAVVHKMYWIEWRADELDVDGGFDCLRVHLAQAGGAALGSVHYFLGEPTFATDAMLGAIYD